MSKNALSELLTEMASYGKTIDDIFEYHILFSPRENGVNDNIKMSKVRI